MAERDEHPTATLEVLEGPQKGHVFRLEREETIVGRLPYCDVLLTERNVSRQHARVVRTRGEFHVEDMNSTNGTFLNGKRVLTRTRLQDQDVVRIYNVALLFREASAGTGGRRRGEPRPTEAGVAATQPATVPPRDRPPDERGVGLNIYEKLRVVLEINKKLGSTLNVQEVLPKILDGLFSVFPQSDRGYILLPDEAGRLAVRAQKQKDEGTMVSSTLGPISNKVAERVLSKGEAILLADGLADDDFDVSDSVLDFPIRSMMCAPLIGPLQKPLGIIYVDTNAPHERFHEDDLEVLLSVAATAGQAIEFAQAHEARLLLDRRERELSMARQVQLHFLPQRRPHIAGYRFFDYYCSAEEIGGDYYGFVPLTDGRLAVAIGDVSGKGISAALIMARLCSEVRYQLALAATPEQAFEELNREFCKPENESWFVTFLLCVLDPARHRLTLLNAGHMPPLCRRHGAGTVEELGSAQAGPPLGCDPSIQYQPAVTVLEPGDLLILFTDGITEAMDADKDLYGLRRLRQKIAEGSGDLDALCQRLLDDVGQFTQEHSQSDDICLLGIQREGTT